MLLTASVLALYPSMTLEKPQQGSALISINADGQAFPIGKNKPNSAFSSATLTLSGSVGMEGNGELKLDDLAGNLQIGISSYTITSGKGEVNKKGKIQINAKTSDGGKNLELILHGSTQGDTVVFDQKQSKLSSLYFLSLKGQAIVTMPTTSTSTTESDEDDDDDENATVTVTQINTITETATLTQNYTVTTTEIGNQTVTETVTQTVTEPVANSTMTVTETVTQTVTEPVANSTATVTETVTSTVANYTETVTTTVANTTLTTTVWNSTLTTTVWNSTQTTPPI